MEILDVVMRLNGPIDPVGDSGADRYRLVNLQALCDLTGVLVMRIAAVAEATDDHLASVKAAKDVAAAFLVSVAPESAAPLPVQGQRGTDADMARAVMDYMTRKDTLRVVWGDMAALAQMPEGRTANAALRASSAPTTTTTKGN